MGTGASVRFRLGLARDPVAAWSPVRRESYRGERIGTGAARCAGDRVVRRYEIDVCSSATGSMFVHMCMFLHMSVCIKYACLYVFACMHEYIYIYMNVYVCMYVCI